MSNRWVLLFAGLLSISSAAECQQLTRELAHHGDVTIEVLTQGRGPLILLLPSLARDSEELGEWAARIASAGYRVIRPRPRGFGRSKGPMENLTLHDFG